MDDKNYNLFEVCNKLQSTTDAIANRVVSFYSSLEEIVNKMSEIMFPLLERINELFKNFAEYSKAITATNILANNQLVYWNGLTDEFINGLIDAQKINTYILNNYKKEKFKSVNQTIEKSLSSKKLKNYNRLYKQSVNTYQNKNYDLALLGFTSIFDGLLSDVSGDISTNIYKRLHQIIEKLESNETLESDEISVIVLIITLQKSLKSFSANAPFDKPEPKTLNRHWIMHGRSHRKRSQLDCIKLINFIYGIILVDELNTQ